MKMFRNSLLLDKSAEKGLRNATIACFFTSLSLMLPFMITIQLFIEVLKPLTGEDVSWNKIWILFGIGICGIFSGQLPVDNLLNKAVTIELFLF